MNPVTNNPVELEEEKKPGASEPPHIRCPLCGWSPRKEDKWFCTCGNKWNTFDTGGVCPACRKGFNPGVKVCPNDGETLVPAAVGAGLPPQQGRGKICPQCGSRFDGSATFCARDATPLAMVN